MKSDNERNNMEYLPKIHEEILSIMDEIHNICSNLNIHYYMVGGTLLGAVRHKGFIPWDDDLDIAMPREDFNRFIDVCNEYLPKHLRLRWITTDKNYWASFAKIENINTSFCDEELYGSGINLGIFVDVFPLDQVECLNDDVIDNKKKIKRIGSCRYYRIIKWRYAFKKKLYAVLSTGLRNQHQLNDLQIKLMTKDNGRMFQYIANYGSNYSISKQTIKSECYGRGVLLPFEGRVYRAPSNAEAILESVFGKNYMKLPPVDKRETHQPKFVKFSDGTSLLL